MSLDTIARPYAQAIFEIAKQNNSIEQWKKVLLIIHQVISFKKIQKFLSGSLSPSYLSSLIIFLIHEYLDENSKNLIKLLAYNTRFIAFNNILKQYVMLESAYKKIAVIELTSAYLLKKEQTIKIRIILEKILSVKIKFIYIINQDIIDGIILKINDQNFDFSIKNYLKQLSLALGC